MIDKTLLKSKIEDGKLILEISTEFLIASQKERLDTPYKITNPEKMLKWVINNIFIFYDDPQTKPTEFEYFINGLMDEAYQDGEAWLEGII